MRGSEIKSSVLSGGQGRGWTPRPICFPSGYFLAQSFAMRNKDVIYTSNAVTVETTKFLVFVRTILATVNDPIIYATNFYALKAAASGTGSTTIITTPQPITTTTP